MKCPCFSRLLKRFPFDSKNPVGYSIATFIEYIICGYEFFTAACTLAVVIGSYWVAISATREIRRILHSINHKTRANKNLSNEIKVLFAEFIDAHASVKQLSEFTKYRFDFAHSLDFIFVSRLVQDFSDIFQPIIMSIFTWSLSEICGVMLIIQIEIVEYTLLFQMNYLFIVFC